MTQFLLHQGRDGVPVGVWRNEDESFYDDDAKESYGRSVVESRGTETEWDDFIEQLASKFPSPKDQWDIYEADGSLELEEVLEEARSNTTYGDSE